MDDQHEHLTDEIADHEARGLNELYDRTIINCTSVQLFVRSYNYLCVRTIIYTNVQLFIQTYKLT